MKMENHGRLATNKILIKLSVLHICSGALSIAIAIAAMITLSHFHHIHSFGFTYVAPGTWCGGVFLITGVSSFLFSSTHKECWENSFVFISASSIIFAGAMFSLELATCLTLVSQNYQVSLVVLHSLLTIISCFEIVVSAVSFAHHCRVLCCLVPVSSPQVKFISGSDRVPIVSAA